MMLIEKDNESSKEPVEHHRNQYGPMYGTFDKS